MNTLYYFINLSITVRICEFPEIYLNSDISVIFGIFGYNSVIIQTSCPNKTKSVWDTLQGQTQKGRGVGTQERTYPYPWPWQLARIYMHELSSRPWTLTHTEDTEGKQGAVAAKQKF